MSGDAEHLGDPYGGVRRFKDLAVNTNHAEASELFEGEVNLKATYPILGVRHSQDHLLECQMMIGMQSEDLQKKPGFELKVPLIR